MKLFRDLTPTETAGYQQWADDNYKAMDVINPTWHPVIQARCAAINAEYDWSFGNCEIE